MTASPSMLPLRPRPVLFMVRPRHILEAPACHPRRVPAMVLRLRICAGRGWLLLPAQVTDRPRLVPACIAWVRPPVPVTDRPAWLRVLAGRVWDIRPVRGMVHRVWDRILVCIAWARLPVPAGSA